MAGKGPKIILIVAIVAVVAVAAVLILRGCGGEEIPQPPIPQADEVTTNIPAPAPPAPPEPVIPGEEPGGEAAHPGEEAEAPAEPAEPAQQATPSEDATVPLSFVEDLARYAVAEYHPARSKHNAADEGRLKLTFKKVNMRYGLNPAYFELGDSPAPQARKTILDYVFHPKVIEGLSALYAKELSLQLVDNARQAMRSFPTEDGAWLTRPLSDAEIAEMLRLDAGMLGSGSKVFKALSADLEIMANTSAYLKAVNQVNEAYVQYWKGQGEQPVADESAGDAIKNAIMERESLRATIIEEIREQAGPVAMSDEEILYLALWAHRRSETNPDAGETFAAIATAMDNLSAQLLNRAAEVNPS